MLIHRFRHPPFAIRHSFAADGDERFSRSFRKMAEGRELPGTRGSKKRRWNLRGAWTPLLLFALLFLIYNANARINVGSDVYCTRFMPVNLARAGSYYFNPEMPYHLGTVVRDRQSPSNGWMISPYSPYTATLLTPFYIPFNSWLDIPPEHYLTFYLDKLFSSLIAAAAGMFTFLMLRRLHGGRTAMPLMITAAMSLGTSLWAIASQGSWAHGPSTFYMIFACWSLDRYVSDSEQRGGFWAAASGWAAAGAFVTRPTNLFFTLPFCLFALWTFRRRWKPAVLFLAGLAPVALWYSVYNIVYFGAPWISGHNYNTAVRRIPHLIHIENFPAGFLGLFFSPSLGLFMTAPFTLFALPGLLSIFRPRLAVRERRDGAVGVVNRSPSRFRFNMLRLAACFAILHALFYSCYLEWWGGYSFAHRYLIDIQPFLALLIGWFFRPGARGRALRWPMFVPAMIFSIAIQFYGAFIWSGVPFYSQMPENKRLYLDLDPNRGHAMPFNHPSFFFSWSPDNQMMLLEMDAMRSSMSSFDRFMRHVTTWDKVQRDLFEAKYVDFSVSPPILLEFGVARAGEKL